MNLVFLPLPDWNSIDAVRNAHSSLELWSIWLFAFLVVCDVVAHLVEDDHKKAAKILERVGLFFFAVAVACELGAYKYGQRNDELSAAQITSLDTKAGDAAASAKTAHDEATGAKTDADNAKTEADAVKVEARELRQQLIADEQRVAMLDSRKFQLTAAAPSLVKQLTPFAGVTEQILLCSNTSKTNDSGADDEATEEIRDTGNALSSILANGAKWRPRLWALAYRHSKIASLPADCGIQSSYPAVVNAAGITVLVSRNASQCTIDAANVLSNSLSAVLPSNPNKKPLFIRPDHPEAIREIEKEQPNTMVILIGRKPQPSR
jgi:hypothetical protein